MQWGQWFILVNVSCFQYCQKLLSGLWESKVCDAILYFSVYISKNMWRIIFKASLLHSILIKQHLAKSQHSMMAVPLTSAQNTRKNLLHIVWIPVHWKMHHWWYVGHLSQVYEKSSFKPYFHVSSRHGWCKCQPAV